MKLCSRCKIEKRKSAFYRDRSRCDKLSHRCKDCERLFKRESRERNLESNKERDDRYYKNHKDQKSDSRNAWRLANKLKVIAHAKLRYALSIGKVKKSNCEVCDDSRVDGHHEDYSKPLKVKWFCRKHHMRKHHDLYYPPLHS